MTRTQSIELFQRSVLRRILSFIQGQMLCYRTMMNGRKEIDMSIRFAVMGFMIRGRSLGTISKVESRIHFIDTKQFLERNLGQEMSKTEKLKRK